MFSISAIDRKSRSLQTISNVLTLAILPIVLPYAFMSVSQFFQKKITLLFQDIEQRWEPDVTKLLAPLTITTSQAGQVIQEELESNCICKVILYLP